MVAAPRQPPFALLLGLAWLLAAAQLLANGWAATAWTLPDADDAMRLVEWREWMAGHGWFDLHEARVAPPVGYDSHWSRLIDAGLWALYAPLTAVLAPALAERVMVVLWPMLWLVPAIGGAAALAWRIAGREAALIVLLLAVFSMPAFQQFRPGRIDHHNVHLTLSILTVAASAWADRWRSGAWVAGVLTGLALAIGFESLPFVALAGAAFALRYVLDKGAAHSLRVYGLTLAAGGLAAFLVSVPPARWSASVCDAIALNSVLGVVATGLGLAIAASEVREGWMARSRAVALAVLPGAGLAILLQPRCLGGPFALVDPAIGPAWIDHVAEVQPLARMMRESLLTGLATVVFPAAGLIALTALWPRRRDPGALLAGGAFIVAFVMTVMMVKAYSYAVWFALPLAGAALLRVRGTIPRFAAALLVTPTALTVGAITLASASGSQPLTLDTGERQACVRKDSAAALARLPPGLILTNELEWGPYILAYTPHAVLAAPYHRLSSLIVTAHAALARPPSAARAIVAARTIDYVVLCGSRGPLGLDDAAATASLWGHLRDGRAPDWLTRVEMPPGQPFTVYRVRRDVTHAP